MYQLWVEPDMVGGQMRPLWVLDGNRPSMLRHQMEIIWFQMLAMTAQCLPSSDSAHHLSYVFNVSEGL
jgi:hypothetical protein